MRRASIFGVDRHSNPLIISLPVFFWRERVMVQLNASLRPTGTDIDVRLGILLR